MATKALPFGDLVSGTVYLLSCELQTFDRLFRHKLKTYLFDTT